MMASHLIESIFLPFLTSAVCVLFVYALVIAKKIFKASVEKSKSHPSIERLKQSLPITVSTSWKLGDTANGVAIWENFRFPSESDNGVIACQAIVQAPAEVVIKELSQCRVLQLVHPCIQDASISSSTIGSKESEDPEISSDAVSIKIKVPSIPPLMNLYFKWKSSLSLRRHWKYIKDRTPWLVISPEMSLHEQLFGVWQCFMAIDLPSENKASISNMCLLSIFAAPQSMDTMPLLKHTISSQILCLREHVDSLYLKKVFAKGASASKPSSTSHKANGLAVKSVSPNDSKAVQLQSPAKHFAGKEERGFVEMPAEINRTPKAHVPNDEQNQPEEGHVVNEKVMMYKDVIDKALKLLADIYEANEETPGWSYLGNRNGVEVYRMQGDSSCPSDCFKGTSEAKVPISYALQYCMNLEFKKEWDDVFNEGSIIEDLDEVTKVTYMEYKPIWPTTARDFCSIVATRHIKGSIYAMAAKAITHPSCPPRKGKQRAEIIAGGFIIEGVKEDPPLCKITYVTRADLKGKIPAGLVNKVNEKQPMYAGIVRDKVEERYMYQDPPSEGDVKVTAARRYPSVIEKPRPPSPPTATTTNSDINQGVPTGSSKGEGHMQVKSPGNQVGNVADKNKKAETITESSEVADMSVVRELSGEEIDELIPENDAPWDTMSESSVTSFDPNEISESELQGEVRPVFDQSIDLPTDAFGNIDHRILGNQTAAKLFEEIHLASEVDSKSKTPENADKLEVWTYQGTMRNVVVLRKIHSNSNFYSFLGRGIIEVLPVTVWDAIKNPSTRFVYDNMLKRTRVVKEIDDGIKIIHLRHETTACFVKQARDFVILTRERIDAGKYVVAGVSVDIPECPLEKNCIRGRVLASGWVIEPVLIKGKLCSLVTYLSQVDFGGKLPIRLINLIAKRQPMSIAYLRTFLESAELKS